MRIFLDVDGVLIHGFHAKPELRELWDKNVEQDLGIKREAIDKHVFNEGFSDVMEGKIKIKEWLNKALPRLNFQGTVEDILNYWMSHNSNINEELINILKQIKQKHNDIKFYIATNQEEYRANYLWNNLGFKDIFEDIFYSAKIGCVKKSPEFFHFVDKNLGITNNQNNLFFDDNKNNVETVKSIGWNAFEYEDINSFLQNPIIKDLI